MSVSPARVVRAYLIQVGLVSHPDDNLAWPAYAGTMPDNKDVCVQLKNMGGFMEGSLLKTGFGIAKPGVELIIRAKDQVTSYDKAVAIWNALGAALRETVEIGGDVYGIQSFVRTSIPVDMGEEVGKRRWSFSIRGRLTMDTGGLP